jgi:hypothetical protein
MAASIALGRAGKGSFRGHEPLAAAGTPSLVTPLYCCHRQVFCIAFAEPPGHRDL